MTVKKMMSSTVRNGGTPTGRLFHSQCFASHPLSTVPLSLTLQQRILTRLSVGTIVVAILGAILLLVGRYRYVVPFISKEGELPRTISVAFLGKSMIYFNDFPRFFEEIVSDGQELIQDSCLHGGASISTLLKTGNGMFPQFSVPKSVVGEYHHSSIHDYGSCTAKQLLLGYDVSLRDPAYSIFKDYNSTTYMNPCREDINYLAWSRDHYPHHTPTWDFVLINDNTRDPARNKTRTASIETLETTYVPWLLETGARPVFLWTQAYSLESTPERNMTGLDDVANFTSLTGAGLRSYVDMLSKHLPADQKPLIAPVGLGFLTIYEENIDMWRKLFHCDHIHASPLGSFLQGCIVHYTLTGRMPDKNLVLRHDMSTLWWRARMMQHAWEPANPFPTREEALYLYSVAERVAKDGFLPASYIHYQNGESADSQ
jgi:hypothetical protein